MFRLLSLAVFREYHRKRRIRSYTAMSYVGGKIFSGSRSLRYLCTASYTNNVGVVILRGKKVNLSRYRPEQALGDPVG